MLSSQHLSLLVVVMVAGVVAYIPHTPVSAFHSATRFPAISHSDRLHASVRPHRQPLTLRMAESILDGILEKKQKEVKALKANTPPEVAATMEKMGQIKNTNAIFKALKKPKGTITVVPMMKWKIPGMGKFVEAPDPEILGGHYYDSGASAIIVCADQENYGYGYDALKLVVKSQALKKGEFPGPLPVIAHEFFIDPIQCAVAAQAGAKGVTLNVAVLGDRTKEMVEAAEGLGMEALVEVHTKEEMQVAINAGAKIINICNRNMSNWELISPVDSVLREWVDPIEETVFGQLAAMVPAGSLKVAMGGVNETLMAWKLRDYGFNSVIVGETLMRGSEMRMSSGPYQAAYNEAKGLIKAFRSKGSVKYGPSSTASFYGKGEGASEQLGMMSM